MELVNLDLEEMQTIWRRVSLLTPTQQKIAELIGDGHFKGTEIAAMLGIHPGTLKTHLQAIYNRTRAFNLLQIAIPMHWKVLTEHRAAIALPETSLVEALSRRELDVARLVAQGYGNLNIALRLSISEHTVKQYLKGIFRKLKLSSRVELAFRVLRESYFLHQAQHSPALH